MLSATHGIFPHLASKMHLGAFTFCIAVVLFLSVGVADTTPTLRVIQTIKEGQNGVSGLDGLYDVKASSDGAFLYVPRFAVNPRWIFQF